GSPTSSATVAGAGSGMRPCAPRTVPPAGQGSAEARTSSTPSRARPTHVPTTSTMASSAPTSWKRTSSAGMPWTRPSASARGVNVRVAVVAFVGVRRSQRRGGGAPLSAGGAHFAAEPLRDVAGQDDVHLRRGEGAALDAPSTDVDVLEPERRDHVLERGEGEA